jgi:hypothetical protein
LLQSSTCIKKSRYGSVQTETQLLKSNVLLAQAVHRDLEPKHLGLDNEGKLGIMDLDSAASTQAALTAGSTSTSGSSSLYRGKVCGLIRALPLTLFLIA